MRSRWTAQLSLVALLVFAAPAGAIDYWTNYPSPAPTTQEFAQIQIGCQEYVRSQLGAGFNVTWGPTFWADLHRWLDNDKAEEAAKNVFALCMQARGFRKVAEGDVERIRALRQQQHALQPPQSATLPVQPELTAPYAGD